MSHLTYAEAGIVGLLQGVTELFPISSLGHSILIPALIGGQWARDLSVSAPNSPYLAFIVGLHVATAIAMIIFFRRDWARIIVAFFASVGHVLRPEPGTGRWEPQNTDQMLAWMIILATIPVAIAGALLQHLFTHVFSRPVLTSFFLFVNGLILLAGERIRRRGAQTEAEQIAVDTAAAGERQRAVVGAGARGAGARGAGARGAGGREPGVSGRHSSGPRAARQQ